MDRDSVIFLSARDNKISGLTMIKAIGVEANDDYTIVAHLEDGRFIKMDMSFVKELSGPVVMPLRSIDFFKKVFVRNGVVTWPTGYDIDPYHLVEQGIVVKRTA